MVSSVSSTPYISYLNQLQGSQTASSAPTGTFSGGASSASGSTSPSLVSSLLGGSAYSSSVLSLLQQDSSGGFDPIATILNGPRTNSALVQLYANLYDSSAASSLQASKLSSQKSASITSPVQDLIDSASKASIAYNQTLQQNSAAAVAAAAKKTSTVTSLIS